MPVNRISNIEAVKAAKRERVANHLNGKRDAQLSFAVARCPVDEGNLVDTIRAEGDATPRKLQAVAKVGGIEANGVFVDYAGDVNFGHATASGGHVSADPFWSEAEEVGRNW